MSDYDIDNLLRAQKEKDENKLQSLNNSKKDFNEISLSVELDSIDHKKAKLKSSENKLLQSADFFNEDGSNTSVFKKIADEANDEFLDEESNSPNMWEETTSPISNQDLSKENDDNKDLTLVEDNQEAQPSLNQNSTPLSSSSDEQIISSFEAEEKVLNDDDILPLPLYFNQLLQCPYLRLASSSPLSTDDILQIIDEIYDLKIQIDQCGWKQKSSYHYKELSFVEIVHLYFKTLL